MGQSTDAILVYGFEIGEEDETPEFMGDFEDFQDYLEDQSGLPKYGEPGHSFDAHREYRKSCPADLVSHCSGDYPMHILAVRGTEHHASRGHAVYIDPNTDLLIDNGVEAEFKAWCAARDIEVPELKWILCSMWN